jgi:hypothetical protein
MRSSSIIKRLAKRVQVRVGKDSWETPIAASTSTWRGPEWLHYELKDGTNALAAPGNWKFKTGYRNGE